jgi:hypothetical protein
VVNVQNKRPKRGVRHSRESGNPGFTPSFPFKINITTWIPASAGMTTFFVALVLIPRGPLYAGQNTGADFLKIPVGARAVSLGNAFTAKAEGVEALNWNPAGLTRFNPIQGKALSGLTLSHQSLIDENSLDTLALSLPFRQTALGFHIRRLTYTEQEVRQMDRSVGGQFVASDLAAGTAIGINFGHFQLGVGATFIRQELKGQKAQTVSFDIGALAQAPRLPFSIGISARNLGPSMTFIEESARLPLTLTLGTAVQIGRPFSLSFDVVSKPYQNTTALSFGTELLTMGTMALRAGYLTQLTKNIAANSSAENTDLNMGRMTGVTAGLGFHFSQFSLDYALAPFGELGNTHSFSFTTYFGNPRQIEPLANTKPAPQESLPKSTNDTDRRILQLDSPKEKEPYWDNLQP